jgi:hypothetical protein
MRLPWVKRWQHELVVADLKRCVAGLRGQVQRLERMRRVGFWMAEHESVLRELKQVLDSSKCPTHLQSTAPPSCSPTP